MCRPPTWQGDSRNYFVNAPFKWNRNQVDTKVNYNATDKLNFIGTFGMLKYTDIAPTIFGDAAIGRLIGQGGNPGMGSGNTYRTTIMGTYTFSPNFLMDAHFGWSKQGTNSEQQDLGQNIGSEVLGIPGTNGTRDFESSWPQFDIAGFDTIGVTYNFMPYYRHDPQFQYVVNFNWIKGAHSIRFGARSLPPGAQSRSGGVPGRCLWRAGWLQLRFRSDPELRWRHRRVIRLIAPLPPRRSAEQRHGDVPARHARRPQQNAAGAGFVPHSAPGCIRPTFATAGTSRRS